MRRMLKSRMTTAVLLAEIVIAVPFTAFETSANLNCSTALQKKAPSTQEWLIAERLVGGVPELT